MLSAIPHARMYAPVTEKGLRLSLRRALTDGTLSAIRYPSGTEDARIREAFYGADEPDDIGVRAWGDGQSEAKITLVTHGRIAATALEVADRLRADGIPTRVLLCEYLAPYGDLSKEIEPMLGGDLIFLEEEIRTGGFGMNLADALARRGALTGRRHLILGTENAFSACLVGQTPLQHAGLDAASVYEAAQNLLKNKEN
jgi:deoxyxylulose-5-phosphate synthase